MSENISDKISNIMLRSSEIPSLISEPNYSSSDSSFFGWIKDISFITWILIILILTFLGFNIFTYLAKGTQNINNVFAPLLEKITAILGGVTGQVVTTSAEGAKAVVNTTSNIVTSGLTGVQNISTSQNKNEPIQENSKTKTSGQNIETTFPKGDIADENSLNKAINSSTSQKQKINGEDYQADDSTSSIQHGRPNSGWCYIGEDRGVRSCAEVGVNDTCMSGDIFPTQQICINPKLRT
jgi:hypothetical protein